jgi:hypothetical protein
VSLDSFLASHTSEDNHSFEQIHAADLEAHRRKVHWMYPDSDGRAQGMLGLYYLGDSVLSTEQRQRMDALLTDGADEADTRRGAPELWRFRVRNALMFPPELSETRDTCLIPATSGGQRALALPASSSSSALRLTAATSRRVSRTADNDAKSKAIVHGNTRLEPLAPGPGQALERPHSPSEYSQADSMDYYAPGLHPATQSRHYRAVPMTPLIEPGALASPLVTWGEAASAPLVLDSDLTPAFLIEQPSQRETLARAMTDRAVPGRPKNRPRTKGSLTPAALALAARIRATNTPAVTSTPFGGDHGSIFATRHFKHKRS